MTTTFRNKTVVCAVIGFAGLGAGFAIDPRTAFASYLVAWTVVCAIPVGALAVLFTAYLVRAGWTHDLRGLLSTAALTLPAVAILFIPVLIGMAHVYPWVSDPAHLPPFKAAYLRPWFFTSRTILYFAVWTALAVWGALAYGDDAAMKRAASVGLIVWALTSSWAGVDWLESLEPGFHSSIYGLLMISFQLLAGLGFAIAALLLLSRTRQMSNAAYAGTLLSVLLLWAYLHAMQYIIIWAGNIPDEVVWYLERLKGAWGFALWALFIFQFILPFFALLSERVRNSSNALLWLAVATVALRYLEAAIFILPPLDLVGVALWLDIPASVLATAAVWLLAWQLAGQLWQEKFSSRAAAPG
jgi:hypothetical protein